MKKSDKSIILVLVGLALAAAAYFGVYQKLQQKLKPCRKQMRN